MAGGFLAPQRRVGFFGYDSTTGAPLTVHGAQFFDTAVLWVTGGDADGDGLIDRDEGRYQTSPLDADSNDDGIPDGLSVAIGLSPANQDSDADGLTNADELMSGTDPFQRDTDGDGYLDGGDAFPLDPTRWALPSDQIPGAAPCITLTEPGNAGLISSVPATPCP
jgi:hypothetical protein